MRMFVDGIQQGAAQQEPNGFYKNNTNDVVIGRLWTPDVTPDVTAAYLDGEITELRLSNITRYTGNYSSELPVKLYERS